MNFKKIWFLSLSMGVLILFVFLLMLFGLLGFERDLLFSLVILLNSLIYLTGLEDIKKGLKRGIAHTFVGGIFSGIIALYIAFKKLVDLLYPLIYHTPIEKLRIEDIVLILLGIVGVYSTFVSYRYLRKGEDKNG
ncbi:MAG TPA: hypothetical protein ENF81_01945 [Thermotogaceae bacterium]|nr:hypothetical protein [Thermotogaceae bacterium]